MATKKQQAEYRKSQAKSKLAWGIAFFFAIVWLVIALVPFLFMILNSFRKQFDMLSQGVFHLPDPWYFENYSNVVANGFFGYLDVYKRQSSLSPFLSIISRFFLSINSGRGASFSWQREKWTAVSFDYYLTTKPVKSSYLIRDYIQQHMGQVVRKLADLSLYSRPL